MHWPRRKMAVLTGQRTEIFILGGGEFQSWIFSRELMRGVHLRRIRLNAGTLTGRFFLKTSSKIPATVTENQLIAALVGKAGNLELM